MEAQSTAVPVENEEYWSHHNQLQKASGLSRADYCRKNGLHYDRFSYWIGRQCRPSSPDSKLIAVKIKPPSESAMPLSLCTLNLKGGHSLKIHDIKALSIILDKMR